MPESPAFAYVDKTTHEPCPTRPNPGGGTILCSIESTDHRHVAQHMVSKPEAVTPAVETTDGEQTYDGVHVDDLPTSVSYILEWAWACDCGEVNGTADIDESGSVQRCGNCGQATRIVTS